TPETRLPSQSPSSRCPGRPPVPAHSTAWVSRIASHGPRAGTGAPSSRASGPSPDRVSSYLHVMPAASGQTVTLPTDTCGGAVQIHAISDAISEGSSAWFLSSEPGAIERPAEVRLCG